jgi:hypothetical protein
VYTMNFFAERTYSSIFEPFFKPLIYSPYYAAGWPPPDALSGVLLQVIVGRQSVSAWG